MQMPEVEEDGKSILYNVKFPAKTEKMYNNYNDDK